MFYTKRALLRFFLEYVEHMVRVLSQDFTLLTPRPGCKDAWEVWSGIYHQVQEWYRELNG